MDKIYKLAEKIINDCRMVKRDYERDIVTKEFYNGIIISSQIILEDIEKLWDIDLSIYYVQEY